MAAAYVKKRTEAPAQTWSVEEVVSENQRSGVTSKEVFGNDEGLREAFGSRLHGVRDVDAPHRTVT